MHEAHAEGLSEASWRDFQTRLRAYVGRRVQANDVDDLVGDILLKLVRSQAALKTAKNPSAWTIRVAANSISDYYRRRAADRIGRASSHYGGHFIAESPEETPGESEADVTREFSGCMTPFIRRLPARYAEALLITDIEGQTQAEAARRLGLSLSAVKSRVRRGRGKLKEALLRCCALELDRRGNIISYRKRDRCCDAP